MKKSWPNRFTISKQSGLENRQDRNRKGKWNIKNIPTDITRLNDLIYTGVKQVRGKIGKEPVQKYKTWMDFPSRFCIFARVLQKDI